MVAILSFTACGKNDVVEPKNEASVASQDVSSEAEPSEEIVEGYKQDIEYNFDEKAEVVKSLYEKNLVIQERDTVLELLEVVEGETIVAYKYELVSEYDTGMQIAFFFSKEREVLINIAYFTTSIYGGYFEKEGLAAVVMLMGEDFDATTSYLNVLTHVLEVEKENTVYNFGKVGVYEYTLELKDSGVYGVNIVTTTFTLVDVEGINNYIFG